MHNQKRLFVNMPVDPQQESRICSNCTWEPKKTEEGHQPNSETGGGGMVVKDTSDTPSSHKQMMIYRSQTGQEKTYA